MCEFEDELVNDTIDAQCSADEFKLSVRRVVEDEVVLVEARQLYTTDTTSELN